MTINLARSTCRACLGAQQSTDVRKQRGNSAKFLPSLRLAYTWRRRSSARTFPPSFFPSGFPFSHLGGQCLQFYAERGRRGEAKTNLHSWVCIRWMSVGEGGSEKEKRGSEGDRGGEERRGRRGASEGPKSEREGNARIEATRPWQQQLLYGVFIFPPPPLRSEPPSPTQFQDTSYFHMK